MLERFPRLEGWPQLAVFLPIAAGAMVLISLLAFLWEFDLATSPAWQVGVHHLVLALFISLTFVGALYRPFFFGDGFLVVMLVLAIAVPLAVFVSSWVLSGPFLGFRDDRIFGLVMLSFFSFFTIWAVSVLPYSFFLLGRAFLRLWGTGSPSGEGLAQTPVGWSGHRKSHPPDQDDAAHA